MKYVSRFFHKPTLSDCWSLAPTYYFAKKKKKKKNRIKKN